MPCTYGTCQLAFVAGKRVLGCPAHLASLMASCALRMRAAAAGLPWPPSSPSPSPPSSSSNDSSAAFFFTLGLATAAAAACSLKHQIKQVSNDTADVVHTAHVAFLPKCLLHRYTFSTCGKSYE